MKLIKCIVRPEKLDEVVTELMKFVTGMTVWEVQGYGRQGGRSLIYSGNEYDGTLRPKISMEIVAQDDWVDDIVKLVIATAKTGEMGDGRIFVVPVQESYQIRGAFMDLD